jgi:hypothetical protein
VIDAPELSRPREPSLDLVRDEEDSMLSSRFTDPRPEIIRWYDRSRLALNRFHDDGSHPDPDRITYFELSLDCFCIAKWDMIHRSAIEFSDWFSVLFFPHH